MASSGSLATKDAAASPDFFQESSKSLMESHQLFQRCIALEAEDKDLDSKIRENRKAIDRLKEECNAKDHQAELHIRNIASLTHQKQVLDGVNSGLRNQICAINKKIAEDLEKYKNTLAKYDAKWESYLEVYNQLPHVREKILLENEIKYLKIMSAKKKQEVADAKRKVQLRNQLHAQQFRVLEEKVKSLLAEHKEWEVERSQRISNIEMKKMQLKALDEEYENMMAKISESDGEAIRQSIWSNDPHLSQISTCGKSRSNADSLLRQPSNLLCGVGNLQAGRSSQFLIPKLNIPSELKTLKTIPTIQDFSSQHTSLTQPALSYTVRTSLPPRTPFSQGRTSVDANRRDDPQTLQTTKAASAENAEQGQNSVMSSFGGIPEGNISHSSLSHEVSPLTAVARNVTASGIPETISSTPLSNIPSLPKDESKKGNNLSKKNEAVCEKSKYEKKTVMTPTPSFLSVLWGRQNNIQATRESSSKLSQDIFISQETQNDVRSVECAIQHNNQAGETPQIIEQDAEEENRADSHESIECVGDTSVDPQQVNPKFVNAEQDSEMYPYECQSPPNFMPSPTHTDESTDIAPPSPQISKNAAEGRAPTIGSNQSDFNPVGFGYRTSVANIFGGPSGDASINSDAPQTGETFYMFQKNSASTFKLF